MPIFDNMDLDELSTHLDKLGRKTFMFVANPLKIKGATGAPIGVECPLGILGGRCDADEAPPTANGIDEP